MNKEDIFDKYYAYDGKTPTRERMLNAMQEFADQEKLILEVRLDGASKKLALRENILSEKETALRKQIAEYELNEQKLMEINSKYIDQLWKFSRLVKLQNELIKLKSKFFNKFMIKKTVELELGVSDIKDSLDQKWLK
jgi:hypothetical protein